MSEVVTSRMAAKVGVQQVVILRDADRIGDGAEHVISTMWDEIKKVIAAGGHVSHHLQNLMSQMAASTGDHLDKSLIGLSKEIYKSAIGDIIEEVPMAVLASLMDPEPLQEARQKATPEQRRQIESMVFGEPGEDDVSRIVYGRHAQGNVSWRHRLTQQTGLNTPMILSAIITQSAARGDTPQKMADALLPYVQGVQSTARRIARTESARIANEARMQAYDALGSTIVGYQIHATMDWRTRPEHAHRSGTIYYKNPKRGQKSLGEMPRPPLESDGTVAHNCRCYLSPVFRLEPALTKDPAIRQGLKDARGRLVPDPTVYRDWFKTAPPLDRVYAVGAGRLSAASSRLTRGQKLDWAHFVDPKTGGLLSADEIENERNDRRKSRIKKNRGLFASLKRLITKVASLGVR